MRDESGWIGTPSTTYIKTTAPAEARFQIADMHERAIESKRGDTFEAFLIESPTYLYIGVARFNDRLVWEGVAGFPASMGELGRQWFDDLETDTDVENLFREWGGEQLTAEFEEFVAHG